MEAMNDEGKEVRPMDADAVSWCLRGGLMKCLALTKTWTTWTKSYYDALDSLVPEISSTTEADELPNWNDTLGRTQSDILEALDNAIGSLAELGAHWNAREVTPNG